MKSNRKWLLGGLLMLAPWLVFFNALGSEFLNWDDHILIFQNPYYQQAGFDNLWHFWKHPHEKLYIPLTYSVWGILANVTRLPSPIYTAVGESFFTPWPFHAANLFLHGLNTLLAYALLRKLRFATLPAAGGALLWSLHPLQAESVCWAAELKGVLCGTFVLGALNQYIAFVRATQEDQGRAQNEWRRRRHYAFTALCFALALLSKPSAVVMPALAWVLEIGLLRRGERHKLAKATLALAPLALVAILLIAVARRAQPIDVSFWHPLWSRPLVAGDAFTFYLLKSLWPFGLTIDYGRTPLVVLSHWTGYASGPIMVLLAWLIWRTRDPIWKTAFGLFIAALLPNSGLVPFIYQAISTVADRYAYLALLGPALVFAALLERACLRFEPRVAGACGVLFLVGLAGQSAFQSLNWTNDITLCTHVLQINPRSYLAHTILGTASLSSARYDEALIHSQTALDLAPYDPQLWANHTSILLKKGDPASRAQAITILQKLLRAQPDELLWNFRLANALMRQGRAREAIPYYRHCLKLNPAMAKASENLELALKQAQRPEISRP